MEKELIRTTQQTQKQETDTDITEWHYSSLQEYIPFYKQKLDDEPLAVQLKEKGALEYSVKVVGI